MNDTYKVLFKNGSFTLLTSEPVKDGLEEHLKGVCLKLKEAL